MVISSDGQSISAVLVSETFINGWADNAYYVPEITSKEPANTARGEQCLFLQGFLGNKLDFQCKYIAFLKKKQPDL